MFDTLNYRQFFSLVIDNLDLKQKLRSMYEWFIFEDNNNNHHVTIDHHHKAESHHHYHHEWPSSITKQNLIEGVDDDVVVIFIIFFLFISMFVYYLFTRYVHEMVFVFVFIFSSFFIENEIIFCFFCTLPYIVSINQSINE